MNQLDLRERVAIITGGARGIGYAAAERALRSGATVVLWDIDSARVERAVAELAPLGTVTAEIVELSDAGTVAGRPGRGSSVSPSKRASRNRARHLVTVFCEQPTCSATVLLSSPSPHARMIRHRNASACDDFARRTHRASCSRSSPVSSSGVFGRPVRGMPHSTTNPMNYWRTTLAEGTTT